MLKLWPFHQHRWVITGAEPVRLTWGGEGYKYVTETLRYCAGCGKTKVNQVDGVWSIEQLGGDFHRH